MTLYRENRMKRTNTLSMQGAEYFYLKQVVHVVISVPQRVHLTCLYFRIAVVTRINALMCRRYAR
jgi:hypothetical protein